MKKPIKILAWTNSSGSAYWRVKDPFFMLNQTGDFICQTTTEAISRELLDWADIVLTQSIVDKNGIAMIYEYQQEKDLKYIVELDDYFTVTPDNPYKLHHDISNASEVIKVTLSIADLVTVSTNYLGKEIEQFCKNKPVVLENYMLMDRWNLHPKMKNETDNVKILWAGSITHIGDLHMVKDAIMRVANEFPNTEWYFVGDIRMMNMFGDIPRSEYMLGTDFLSWATKLQGIRADIGIAPLKDAQFTRCKSAIKAYEYGINEIPCIASPVQPYQEIYDQGFPIILAGSEDEWYNNLKYLINNPDERVSMGKKMYNKVRKDCDLERHIRKWSKAYKSVL